MLHSEELRLQKALAILSQKDAIQKIEDGLYTVRSQSGIGVYKLEGHGRIWSCNCPDFVKNGNMRPCKHVLALRLHLDIDYKVEKGEEKQIIPITYSQNWSNYNQAQSNEIEIFDRLLYELCSSIPEPEQNIGRPKHPLKDLIFCCIMKVYSQLSSRRSQCLFEQALERNEISENIHYNALSRTLLKKEITPLLYDLVHYSAQPLASVETDFAVDSSGFRCSTFNDYCSYAHGTNRVHNWLKVHICTGVKTNIVADVVVTGEHSADSPQFKKLIQRASEFFNIDEVSADAAYSSRLNHEIVHRLGGTAYIPFKSNATGNTKGSKIWEQAFHYFQLHREEFLEHYHKRSNAETTFSAIKNKFGETIKSKNKIAQINEMLCKIIAYNLTVVIREMIEFGFNTNYFLFNDLQKEEKLKQSNEYKLE